jgi:hypothetical protein
MASPKVAARACPEIGDLPADCAAEALARIEAREAAGVLDLDLACAACGTRWRETLDVAAAVWAEIAAASWRLMAEIADLAAAFGWSEQAILALSPARRRAYLALARGG